MGVLKLNQDLIDGMEHQPGYSWARLRAAFALAGYKGNYADLAELMSSPQTQANYAKRGHFTRDGLVILAKKCNMTRDQFIDVFFKDVFPE